MRREYTKQERLTRACRRVAMLIRGMWEERGASDTRLVDGFLIPDELTIVGHSKAFTGKGRREHVVPRRVIVLECHRMLEQGATDEEIGAFIEDHVKIVMISPDEAERLDRRAHVGLRQRMPDGWVFGTDHFARLDVAKIEWVRIDGDA